MNEKTQPQKLLEEIIPHDENEKSPSDPEPLGKGETKFPTIEEQNAYWQRKETLDKAFGKLEAEKAEYMAHEATRPPRKWSLARRRKFNATLAKKKLVEHPMYDYPPKEGQIPLQENPTLRFCPCCGRNIERFLA